MDLTATEIRPDGSRAIERFEAVAAPRVDCFWIYPTVDLSLVPGNHEDLSTIEPMARTTVAQAARFRSTCALYAPLYRQITLGSYLRSGQVVRDGLAKAFADVEAAFVEYLARYDQGRPIVLLGHSQGGDMVVRLLQRFFDKDPALRARLLVALPIGTNVETAAGRDTGGSFANIPVCRGATQTGCVVAYRSHAAGERANPGRAAPPPGEETVCVNPADIERNELSPFAAAYLPVGGPLRGRLAGVEGVETPFVVLRNFYAGRCLTGENGYRYLAVSLAGSPGDVRQSPFDFEKIPFHKVLGLHIVDFQLPQGDLIDLVARRVAALH